MSSPSYTLVGAGGVGGFYGALLARAGRKVRFVLRSDFELVKANGLRVESPLGDLSIDDVDAWPDMSSIPPSDAVVVTLKATQNEYLRPHLARMVAPGGCVILLQNGFGVEEEVSQWLPPDIPVLGGLAFLCSYKCGPGHIVHQDFGGLRLGLYEPGLIDLDARGRTIVAGHSSADKAKGRAWLERVVADLAEVGIQASAADHLEGARWQKLVWNIPFNGLSVILNTDTRSLVRDPASAALVRSLMEEVVRAAGARGYQLPPNLVDRQMSDTEKMVPYQPSMRLDWLGGRPMEIDAIYTRPLEAAAAAGCPMNKVSVLRDQLRFLQEARKGESP